MLLTRPPLDHFPSRPKPFRKTLSLDLHVLSVPPAFILSQDQTLNLILPFLLGFLRIDRSFLTVLFFAALLAKQRFFFSDVTLFDFQCPRRSFESAYLIYHISCPMSSAFFTFLSASFPMWNGCYSTTSFASLSIPFL